MKCVDSVVTGEEEGIWPQILEDARNGEVKVKSFISFCSLLSLWCWITLFRDENQCNYLNPCRRR